MRSRRRTAALILLGAALGALAVAPYASAAVTSRTHATTVTPTLQSGTAFGGVSLEGVTDQTYGSYAPPSPNLTGTVTHFDDDFAIDTTGLAQCPLASLTGVDTAQALANCPTSKVGSGSQTLRIDPPFGFGTISSVLTLFNGPPSAGNPTVLVHSRFEPPNAPFAQTFVATCVLEPSSLGGDFGIQTTCGTGSGGGTAGLLQLSTLIDDVETSPGHRYLSARCADPDQTWNFVNEATYSSGPPIVVSTTVPCQVAATDGDGDGIDDVVDTSPATVSDGFDDGDGTVGTITDRADLDVKVADSVSAVPNDGVHVSAGPGTGPASFDSCGFTYTLSADGEADITCASLIANVTEGVVTVVLAEELTTISMPAGVNAEVTDNGDGSFAVENLGAGDVTVTVDGVPEVVSPGETSEVDGVNLPTSKNQCKKDGWRDFHNGSARFRNQGDCVSYVATGGANPPRG